ncbi:SDR family NAD(P)-dependent oxidoreductase [Rhodovarius crocodyli]|uniref:SDR family NAD(P)-dependent oxidoreductase n=1 Tax=Rhodovarius crocodyli TaxID=1979269 RepID=A0A437MLP6_9PROT|nr:SDR family NAD(P)-dependent oxidoreductase [Rhodovarius crocodyli]RVT98584.1 SDR family NAD(P)-dependent oxidoreductase [Rhodovarius crocodyli]
MRFANALITGASSGIGVALARALAMPGATLHLSGRDAARLEAVAEACRAQGAAAHTRVLDVRDADAMQDWVLGAGRLDLVLANAGIGTGTGDATEPAQAARDVFDTNVTGVLNTCLPAMEVMAAQTAAEDGWRGHVAVVASLAAFVAGPSAPAYCASKSAVQRWAEARDATERRRGIRMHALCPGFIRTPMTARNAFPMPFLMEPDQAAKRMLDGIAAGKLRIAFPRRLYAMSRLVGALPPGLRARLLEQAPPKHQG